MNVFKHFEVGKWKKCTKEGDVITIMVRRRCKGVKKNFFFYQDRDVKATVFRIYGSIPASNFILIPKTASQSLSLTGAYLFLVFKPLPSKYFVVHLEVVNTAGLVVRVSFSNLFKEFKSTSTWLQFPFRSGLGGGGGPGVEGGAKDEGSESALKSSRWTFLSLNLKEILSKYLSCKHSYLKNIKLCANILVKNVFTSDLEYSPLASESKIMGQYLSHLPREMALPLAEDVQFLDVYDYFCFPCEKKKMSILHRHQLKGMKSKVVLVSEPPKDSNSASHVTRTGRGKLRKSGDHVTRVIKDSEPGARVHRDLDELADHEVKEGGGLEVATHQEGPTTRGRKRNEGSLGKLEEENEEEAEVHVFANQGTEIKIHREKNSKMKKTALKGSKPTVS